MKRFLKMSLPVKVYDPHHSGTIPNIQLKQRMGAKETVTPTNQTANLLNREAVGGAIQSLFTFMRCQ